jgi:hypothetical protein
MNCSCLANILHITVINCKYYDYNKAMNYCLQITIPTEINKCRGSHIRFEFRHCSSRGMQLSAFIIKYLHLLLVVLSFMQILSSCSLKFCIYIYHPFWHQFLLFADKITIRIYYMQIF